MPVAIRTKKSPSTGKKHLFFDFFYRQIRCRESTGLENTPKNRKAFERKARIIDDQIAIGTFDYADHFPEGNKLHIFAPELIVKEKEPVKYKDFADEWYRQHSPAMRGPTAAGYKGIIEKYLKPALGEMFIEEIDSGDVREIRADIERDFSGTWVRRVVGLLRRQMKIAVEDGYRTTDPTSGQKFKGTKKNRG